MSKVLVGKSLFGGHNLPPPLLIGIGLTNLPKYGDDKFQRPFTFR